jgi:membrane protein
VIVLMTWFYITGFIFIMGGEINAILDATSRRRRAHAAGAIPSAGAVPGGGVGVRPVKDWTGVPNR